MLITAMTGCTGTKIVVEGILLEDVEPAMVRDILHKLIDKVPDNEVTIVLEALLESDAIEPEETADDGDCEQCGSDFTTSYWKVGDDE